METIQIAIANSPYAAALRELLSRSGPWEVLCVECPDWTRDGVMVLDPRCFELAPSPLERPERVVLIAPNDPGLFSRAWEAGVNSVVNEKDPIDTAVLAVMSARLRVHLHRGEKPREHDTVRHGRRHAPTGGN
jgi:hypothetical protein